MPTQSELDKLLVQARRIAEHREQNAEKEIRKMYKALLKDLQLFLSDTYLKKAENDVLTYAILQQKGGYARFLEELTKQIDLVTAEESKLIKQTVSDIYSVCYDGMIEAVQKSVTADDLESRLQGLKGANTQQIKRAVENPVSGLTLNDTLEKHRKDIIWEIRKQVGIGLTQGDSYTSMAKRLAEQYDMGYKKAVRITRTETHRAKEAGFNDSADETQSKLIGTGLVMTKTWQTMDDSSVRPNGKKKKTGANHVLMDGQIVLQDEDFELYEGSTKSGDKTTAPSQSGIASQDINCRCFVTRKIMTVQEFEALTGRKLDEQYHKQEVSEKEAETVDISENSSIINSNEETEVSDVNYIGKIDKSIYSCVTEDITTDEVIITDKQIEHIKERHPDDYERYFNYISEMLERPDYILEANRPDTAFILKHINDNGKNYQLILRLKTSKDPNKYKNSIITFLKIKDKEYNRCLRNKKILYKSE